MDKVHYCRFVEGNLQVIDVIYLRKRESGVYAALLMENTFLLNGGKQIVQ